MNILERIKLKPLPLIDRILGTTPVRYSTDGKYYYIDNEVALKSRRWLSVDKFIANPENIKKFEGNVFGGGVEITKVNGEHYVRQALPFAFFELHSRVNSESIRVDDDLVLDYLTTTG